jgi:hypothetical protein
MTGVSLPKDFAPSSNQLSLVNFCWFRALVDCKKGRADSSSGVPLDSVTTRDAQ